MALNLARAVSVIIPELDARIDTMIPIISISATPVATAEGNSGTTNAVHVVTRSRGLTRSDVVNYVVTAGQSNPANATDFVGGVFASGSITFGVGDTQKSILVPIAGDTTVEPDENYTVTISIPGLGVLGNAVGYGVITNDDAATAIPSPTSNFSVVTEPKNLMTYQRTTFTGGALNKGKGSIPVTLNPTTLGQFVVRLRDPITNAIVQAPWVGGTFTATGSQAVLISGADAVAAWAYLDYSGDGVTWILGTTLCGVGRRVAFAGQSLAVRGLNTQGSSDTNTITATGTTVNPNASAFATYDGYNPTLATANPQLPATGGNYDALFVAEFLNRQQQQFGCLCSLVGHTIGGSSISAYLTGGSAKTQFEAVFTASGGAAAFEAAIWYQGHGDSIYAMPDKPYAAALTRLRQLWAAMNGALGDNFTLYFGTIPDIGPNTAWGSPFRKNRVRLGAERYAAANPTKNVHVKLVGVTQLDGIHEDQLGSKTMAQGFARATRPEAGLTGGNDGPLPISATRSGLDVTVTYSNAGTALVAIGSLATRAWFFSTGRTGIQAGESSNRFPVASAVILNATQVKYTLANDPGVGHVLDFYQNFPGTAGSTTDLLTDNRTDGDGIAVGRYAQSNAVPVVVAAPTPGGAVNAPPGGYVARPGLLTNAVSAAFGAEEQAGFGQTLNAGYATAPVAPVWNSGYTASFWWTAPNTAQSAQRTIFSMPYGQVYMTSGGQIKADGTTGTGPTVIAGHRYHFYYIQDLTSNRLYMADITAGTGGALVVSGTGANLANVGSGIMYLRSIVNGASQWTEPSGVTFDQCAIYQTTLATGSTYTPPGASPALSDPDIVFLWTLNGDVLESVGA